jgi:hypothetical protein
LYLRLKHHARLIFDPKINHTNLKANEEWDKIYGDVKKEILSNAPKPQGKSKVLLVFVDSDDAGDQVTRISGTRFIQMVNMETIIWHSKKQGSIESSEFRSEFVGMKVAMEAYRALRYMLLLMGVPIDGPTFLYWDNKSVVYNTTDPESMLKKKSISCS